MTTVTPISRPPQTAAQAAAKATRRLKIYASFDELPDSALVRQSQLVRDPKKPGIPVPLPFAASTLWIKVANGTFPAPIKLSSRTTVWRVSDVRAWIASAVQAGSAA